MALLDLDGWSAYNFGALPPEKGNCSSAARDRFSDRTRRMRARVLVVESHPVTRWGLSRLIDRQADLAVVREAGSAHEAVQQAAVGIPDVVTIGLPAAEGHGLPLARELRGRFAGIGLVVFAGTEEDDVLLQAFEIGISAFVPKSAPVDEVVAAVRHASVAASSFTASGLSAALRRRRDAPALHELSAREREVLDLLVEGGSVPSIAAALHISLSTAKTYVARLYDKLGARNRADAVMAAVRLGLTGHAPRPSLDAPLDAVAL
jgi:DNA-binding NarL/FixJ family response regulator